MPSLFQLEDGRVARMSDDMVTCVIDPTPPSIDSDIRVATLPKLLEEILAEVITTTDMLEAALGNFQDEDEVIRIGISPINPMIHAAYIRFQAESGRIVLLAGRSEAPG